MEVEISTMEEKKRTGNPEPKVSVIMPSYNRASLIRESIDSVLDQEFTDIELIIVDDGSSDGTGEMVLSINDPRIRYVHQDNRGVVIARNTGLALARGEYVFFLDSDDILMEGSISKTLHVMERNPDVGFCFGQAYLIDENRHIFGIRRQRGKPSYIREGVKEIETAALQGNHIPTSTIMVRRAYLEKVGLFDNTFNSGSEDFELWVRLARQYSVAYLAEPLVKYRVHSSSITGARHLANIEKNNTIIIERIFDDPESQLSLDKSKVYENMFLRLAYYAYGCREMKLSRNYLFRSLKTRPESFMKTLWLPLFSRLIRTWFPPWFLNAGHKVKHTLCVAAYSCGYWVKSRRDFQRS